MAFDFVSRVDDVIWRGDIWLPDNVSWNDIVLKRESGEMFLPLPRDLWVPLPIAVVILIVRLIVERFVAQPIGQYYNLRK